MDLSQATHSLLSNRNNFSLQQIASLLDQPHALHRTSKHRNSRVVHASIIIINDTLYTSCSLSIYIASISPFGLSYAFFSSAIKSKASFASRVHSSAAGKPGHIMMFSLIV
jgi:hypothetical protein